MGVSGPSLLIESTNSMIVVYRFELIYYVLQNHLPSVIYHPAKVESTHALMLSMYQSIYTLYYLTHAQSTKKYCNS